MNIVNKLTLRHLKFNRRRTWITILGIIISVAMITATFVSIASFMDMIGQQARLLDGDAQVTCVNVSKETARALAKDDRVDRVGVVAGDLDGATAWQIKDAPSYQKGTGNLYIADPWNLTQMISCSYDGVLPKNSSEIALEQSVIDDNDLDIRVGDQMTLELGNRCIMADGEKQIINSTGYATSETFEVIEKRTFTVTAILQTNPATKAYGLVVGLDEAEFPENVNAMVSLKKADHTAKKTLEQIAADYDFAYYLENSDYLISLWAVDQTNRTVLRVLPLVLMILGVIVTAAVMMIYNAFGMSLAERVRYLGMLASVGATKRQKRRSIYFEGFILGMVGIPLGLAFGYLGIAVTMRLVGDRIIGEGLLGGITNANFKLRAVMPVWALVGILIVSALTIFISSYVPARKASKIMPIDALRQTNEIKLKSRKLRTPKPVRVIFGYEGEIAWKNLKRNGRKARVITVSIAISMILFLCANYFTKLIRLENGMSTKMYEVEMVVDYDDCEQVISELEEMKYVSDVFGNTNVVFCYEEGDNPDNEAVFNSDTMDDKYQKLFEVLTDIYIKCTDSKTFNRLCEANGLDASDFYSGDSIKGLLVNNISREMESGAAFKEAIIGQSYYYGDVYSENGQPIGIEIGALIDWNGDEAIMNTSPSGVVQIIVPDEALKVLYKNYDYTITVDLAISTDHHEEVMEQVATMMAEENLEGTYWDIAQENESMEATLFVFEVFMYGFIFLIMLVTVTNIINTISDGIDLRRKEFAMLQSAGLAPCGLKKMIRMESLLYGIRAVIAAWPLSILINFGLNTINGGSVPFAVDWLLYLIVTAVVFGLILLVMLVSAKGLETHNIVEILKEDM